MPESLNLFIDGKEVPARSGATFPSLSPTTGEVVHVVAAAGEPDVAAAVDAARRAFPEWSTASYVDRRRTLLAAADALEAESAQARTAFALETGGTAGWAAMNVAEAAATLREAAALTSVATGELLPSHDPRSVNMSVRSAAGVVLAIVPWNAPLVLAARSVAIALAMGNTVVIRPSEQAPLTAGHLLARALSRAGIPDGVVNVVSSAPGEGRAVITRLVEHPAVRRVVFIGSTPVGRSIAELAGAHLTPAVMELGGKNPTVVLADADVDEAARTLGHAAFANSGQVCMATDRVIVSDDVADAFLEQFSAVVADLRVGDPRAADTDLGPLINEPAVKNYRRLVDDALDRGAAISAGSGEADGLFATPVVLTDIERDAALFHEEAFSPVVSVHRFHTDAEAVALANDTHYGLIASVISGDTARGLAIASRLRTGAVHVNGSSIGDEPHVPFGGVAWSGFGRLGGIESVRTFTEQRTIYAHGLQLNLPALS